MKNQNKIFFITFLLPALLLLGGYVMATTAGGETLAEAEVIAPAGWPNYETDICSLPYVFCDQTQKNSHIWRVDNIMALISYMASKTPVSAETALRIAFCESSYNPTAKNPNSTAKGLFQFIDKTWYNYCEGDVLDPYDNTKCFLEMYPKYPHWWVCK